MNKIVSCIFTRFYSKFTVSLLVFVRAYDKRTAKR